MASLDGIPPALRADLLRYLFATSAERARVIGELTEWNPGMADLLTDSNRTTTSGRASRWSCSAEETAERREPAFWLHKLGQPMDPIDDLWCDQHS